jgi:hypothetical protein
MDLTLKQAEASLMPALRSAPFMPLPLEANSMTSVYFWAYGAELHIPSHIGEGEC